MDGTNITTIHHTDLNATGLETTTEYLLELGDVVEVHESVVLAWNVRERGLTAAEARPGLELVVEPVRLAAA